MKTTFWQAEAYKSGQLISRDFERCESKWEAVADAEAYLHGLGDFDRRHNTAGVCEWTVDAEGNLENTGNYEEVTI